MIFKSGQIVTISRNGTPIGEGTVRRNWPDSNPMDFNHEIQLEVHGFLDGGEKAIMSDGAKVSQWSLSGSGGDPEKITMNEVVHASFSIPAFVCSFLTTVGTKEDGSVSLRKFLALAPVAA